MQSSSVGANSLSAYLSGTWRVHRRISFRSRSATAESAEVVLNGECCFESKESQRITASEFCSDECQRLQGRREDDICLEEPWSGKVFTRHNEHDEGFFLSSVDLLPGVGMLRHRCGDDCYTGRWTLKSDSEFEVLWYCNGPCREYCIHATYTKQCKHGSELDSAGCKCECEDASEPSVPQENDFLDA